ncbi:tRNA pseudouridine(55) synthase TruB [Niallia taxi]|uniref:tRNA pseudouridine synthase B n=1 Tax=Niallia taxi TaxID=2499688 RepID=A0A437KFL6_9BACI|nr:tRNA pseudouridine(55) synthase TruB [Niallia taxi]MCM3214702.1 tRNA pseudouridine(55) synthase TruB [Niallia taxi]RVT67057.1 tRNA pseudouridine(55) synthase TruB [Niallia taxi]
MEGILPLWKPKGMTSHDCVFKLRKILRMKRIGHTGTLDPDVTGVLPICLGRATKVAEYITDAGKSYEGEVTIGYSTTTEDSSGEKVEEKRVKGSITREQVEEVLQSLTGVISQTPPMYSAVKVNGKRLYEYARAGIEVERPTRNVTIYKIELLEEWDSLSGDKVSFRFKVDCSKGTYIRTLAVMIGEKLGYPAHMSDLSRTRSATMTLDDCLTLEQIEEAQSIGVLEQSLRPIEDALSYLPKYEINDTLAMRVRNGAVLETPPHLMDVDGPIAVFSEEGEALAIYIHHPSKEGMIKPSKILKVLE